MIHNPVNNKKEHIFHPC